MRSVQGISQKMLTQTLRELERTGVIERKSYPEVPPRVEYSLTPLGETLSVVVMQLEHWVVDNYEQVTDAQVMFDMQGSPGQPTQSPTRG
jgi:DNA-binding HxlR family transcriptional regulator